MRGGSDFSGVGVSSFTANTRMSIYLCAMPYVTRAELIEIVPDLRAMATAELSVEVRAALNRLADRYAAMAVGSQKPAWIAVPELAA